ncbi:type VI secretion system protein TssA [Caulobacter sp. RL271]|uniref:Type VI secretion system ImpA family N-terminal domain-containing protein n=1 Tax=Caulobacter segnis TaxID=88688 RepID=A0ABY4ZPT4_9CAUL|nr:type VI secretion system ImpA family N-terminal domain-containing protein [Caulobacter segnis]USQ93981.1 type VI secretion system ImpA family N-terminal domain-containing protein [Caulobacter segnis]
MTASNMALDLGRLLAPVSEADPTGPDLAYDPARYEIEQAFETEVSIDASGVETQPSEVDWRTIVDRIVEQSDRTKDLWLAAYLCRAAARAGQLETVELGTRNLAGLLETYWPSVHPRLEDYGFQGRKGPCDSLVSQAQFLAPLRKITLISHPRLGRYSIDDFERFRLRGESEEGYGMFRAALEDLQYEGLDDVIQRLDAIENNLRRADLVLTSNADDVGGTNFKDAYDALGQMRRAIQAFSPEPAKPETSEPPTQPHVASSSFSNVAVVAARLETRDDVIRALDALSDYYQRKEPGHPILTLMRRAREWVGQDFMSILEDIAPGSLDEARSVLQSRKQREQS